MNSAWLRHPSDLTGEPTSPHRTPPRGRRRTVAATTTALCAATLSLAACSSAADRGNPFGGSDDSPGAAKKTSVVLLEQPWVDLQVENEITRQLLTTLGYTVVVKSVSVELGAQALSAGSADAYLGNWWPSQKTTFASLLANKSVTVVNPTMVTGTQYAPAVPGDVAQRLGVRSLADLAAHADEFGRKIYGIEPGSPGNATIAKAIAASDYGLGGWSLVQSGTPAMLAQVERAQRTGQAIVFLGWSPHWMTVQFKTTFLADPLNVWGGGGTIRSLARTGFTTSAPDITRFLKNETYTVAEAGEFYYAHDRQAQAIPAIATQWIAHNPAKVTAFCDGVTSADGRPASEVLKP